jgi:hypothetical protein
VGTLKLPTDTDCCKKGGKSISVSQGLLRLEEVEKAVANGVMGWIGMQEQRNCMISLGGASLVYLST